MMCLPSIQRLHDRREEDRKRIRKGQTMTCDCCCGEFGSKAEGRFVEEYWSPLIADKPSGLVTICPKCAEENRENHGQPWGEEREGYFECADCGRLNIWNYSWEVYANPRADGEDGYWCAECAGKRALAEDSPAWLDSADDILRATAGVETLQAYGPRHLTCIGGHKGLPHGCVSFRDTKDYREAKLDWFSKMEMGGWGGDNTHEVRECALAAFRFYSRVAIIVGEAGQFQVYLDIVVSPKDRRKKARKPGAVSAA